MSSTGLRLQAQNLEFTFGNLYALKVSGLPAVGCGEESGHSYGDGSTMCPEEQSVPEYLNGTPKSKCRIMQAGSP